MNSLVKWARLPLHKKGQLISTFLLVAAIRFGLSLLPFKNLRRLLTQAAQRFRSDRLADQPFIDETIWAVGAVAKRVLGDAPCLTQALTAQYLLERRNYPTDLVIGVSKGAQGELLAHAWVERNGQVVIGGTRAELAQYTRLISMDGFKL